MSSGIESGGSVAAIIMLPVGVALGAGWLAWEAGKLVFEANRAINKGIDEKKRQAERAEEQRKIIAIACHKSLVDMCHRILEELDAEESANSSGRSSELEMIRSDLIQICNETIPEETAYIESLNSKGLLKLDQIVNRKKKLANIEATCKGEYDGLSVADLMDDLRLAFFAADLHEMSGVDVRAADPLVLERSKLNTRLAEVSARITSALEFVTECSKNIGLSKANQAWFHSCFNGIDIKIQELCSPQISNVTLKKGIISLEELMNQFEMIQPSVHLERLRFSRLYSIYTEAANGLGEEIYSPQHFSSADEIEAELYRFKVRAEKAKKCAEIYQKLGASAYMCYAWDQELKALGYNVHTRKSISQLAEHKPERATLGEAELPFYQWDEKSLTQFYSLSPQCNLQIIVHPDGSTTMQTISSLDNKQTVDVQKQHCDRLALLHKRLRENWFVLYDYRETASASKVTTAQEWRLSSKNMWRNPTEDQKGIAFREIERREQEKSMKKR